jgi:hypothetical protein
MLAMNENRQAQRGGLPNIQNNSLSTRCANGLSSRGFSDPFHFYRQCLPKRKPSIVFSDEAKGGSKPSYPFHSTYQSPVLALKVVHHLSASFNAEMEGRDEIYHRYFFRFYPIRYQF